VVLRAHVLARAAYFGAKSSQKFYFSLLIFFILFSFYFFVGVFFLSFPNYDREVMSCYIGKFPGETRSQGWQGGWIATTRDETFWGV